MKNAQWNVVTGATGYTGKYITRRLLGMGEQVKTLTGHPNRHNPFGSEVPVLPFNFDNPDALTESLRDVHAIYNTYWVRFTHGHASYDQAVKNTKTLIQAAKAAGVQRFVHVSIANPDKESTLPYYKGKALLEEALVESGLSYAILRPTVIFGPEDILINNIAWLLRKFPLFAIPGSGQYGIQPIFVEDMAELAVQVARDTKNVVKDAVGPETFTFKGLVHLLARKIRSKSLIFHLNPRIALALTKLISFVVKDVILTDEEMDGLLADLLASDQTPTGKMRFTDWLGQNIDRMGAKYANELEQHFRPSKAEQAVTNTNESVHNSVRSRGRVT